MTASLLRLVPQRWVLTVGLSAIVLAPALACGSGAAWAADPFRTSNAKPIGDKTEAVFNAIFKEGNYAKADKLMPAAESKEANEPLLQAMKATLAYGKGDLNTFRTVATTTREKAEQLVKTDKLRGNIYLAVGNFLEGVAIVKDQGLVKGAPGALGKVEAAFQNLDEAEKIDAQDPELNILKGNIDLMLAVNIKLPLSDPDKAIARLEGPAGPRYIADRSLGWGYRDLKKQDKAMSAVDRALKSTPTNPELQYLKAQIFVQNGDPKSALDWFKKALDKKSQLPGPLATQIEREQRLAQAAVGPAKPAEPMMKKSSGTMKSSDTMKPSDTMKKLEPAKKPEPAKK
jgi:tetratricopeptide (TPR) repeat protein